MRVYFLHLVLALGLAVGLHAAEASPQPPAVAAPAGAAITVTLKDGQKAGLSLRNYDRFFLSATNAKGTRFDLPWSEVASVDSNEDAAGLAAMRANISSDSAPVKTMLEPRYPGKAFERALWPGILVHGSGYRYVGDHDAFVDLAGAGIFGLGVGAFGAYLQAYPNSEDTNKTEPEVLLVTGAVIFGGTWLWDLCFSPSAARSVDSAKGLAFEPSAHGDGAQLAYHF